MQIISSNIIWSDGKIASGERARLLRQDAATIWLTGLSCSGKSTIAFELEKCLFMTEMGVCEHRDQKGLYKKARAGEINNFTGISAPYEAPENPALAINPGLLGLEDCIAEIFRVVRPHFHKE